VIIPRTGVHWRGEYKGINTASTIIGSGAMRTGEGKRRVVHHEWTLENVTNLLREYSWEARRSGDGAIFGRQLPQGREYSVGNKGEEGCSVGRFTGRR